MRLVSTFCDANKLDIPKEMNKFLERYVSETGSGKKIENPNRPITNKETETVIISPNLHTQKK